MKYIFIALVLFCSTVMADDYTHCVQINNTQYSSDPKIMQCTDKSTIMIFSNNVIVRTYADKSIIITKPTGIVKIIDSNGKVIYYE